MTILNAAESVDPDLRSVGLSSFAIGLRDIQHNAVFFALSQPDFRNNCFNGEHADTNPLIPKAFQAGALLAVTRRDRFERHRHLLEAFENRIVFVDDVIRAIQSLASHVYRRHSMPVVAITGSAGKTTTKEMVAAILREEKIQALVSVKNRNNGLGLPLTLLKLCKMPAVSLGVVEMGMSTPDHEIARLCTICPPTIAVLLNVLPVHIQHLGSIDAVAKAKAEIFDGLIDSGTAVLNADDPRVMALNNIRHASVKFGIRSMADVHAEQIRSNHIETRFQLHTPRYHQEIVLPMLGRHHVQNALAAASVAHVLGITPSSVTTALGKFRCLPQRGAVIPLNGGSVLIDESYNSNPVSLRLAIDNAVAMTSEYGRLILIIGDMSELGPEEESVHFQAGLEIGKKRVDLVFGVGRLARLIVAGLHEHSTVNAIAFDTQQNAFAYLPNLRRGDVILVKGSRSARLEKFVAALASRHGRLA